MLTRPADLSDDALAQALERHWGFAVAGIAYRPVGFGSHHWAVTAGDGTRFFVTVDELAGRRRTEAESLDTAFARLSAALATARDLAAAGGTFVVAPLPTRAGEPLLRLAPDLAVALYPFVDGEAFSWGSRISPADLRAVLDMLVALHAAPAAARRHAMTDDFFLPHRDRLEEALEAGGRPPDDTGPYAAPMADLLLVHASRFRAALRHCDHLAAAARANAGRAVLTHGEPHPGNTMRTNDGWRLVDWDTVLLAPPERDLWMLHQRDGSILEAYADATGTTADASLLELYRLNWDLADLAVYVDRFTATHDGNLDDDKSWAGLTSLVERLPEA